MSITQPAPAQAGRDTGIPAPPTPRVLDAAELATATGGGVVLGSRTGVMIGSAARTGIVIVV